MKPDPRINAFRPDLADKMLRDTVKAKKYVEPVMRQCLQGVLPMLAAPKADAQQISQIRYGEYIDVFEARKDGFLWIQNRSDKYVGYVPDTGHFGDSISMMSNRITALRTFVYPKPDLKAPPVDELTLGSFVSITGKHDRFLELAGGGFIVGAHVMASEYADTADYVFTAGRMLHCPYLWGGRTPKGIDCSGLVQLALEMAGIEAPRDSDLQCEVFGKPLDTHWRDRSWKRGDIVFFKGHAGLMANSDHVVHANAHTMDVTVEPLMDVVARGNDIIAVGDHKDVIKNR